MDVFTSLFDALDSVLDQYVNEAITSATGYVDGPITVLGIIAFIAMGAVLLRGMSELPLSKFIQTAALLALVFALAGSAGHYNSILADHLRALPSDLLATFSGIISLGDETSIGAVFDGIGDRAMTGISAIWSAGGFTDPGPSLFAAILFVIFLIFGVAAVIALATAKIGLSLVVAVGPLMIIGLLFQSTREYFTKWLSYGIQFAFLALFVGGIAGMADAIVDNYIDVLDDSPENVDLIALMAPALMLLLLAKIFAELPNMASSLSGGIGLSIGNSAWRGIQGAMHHAGGKHIDAWRDAARWRRVRGAEALHERMVKTRQAAFARLVHGAPKVSRTDSNRTASPSSAVGANPDLDRDARNHLEARRRRRAGG
ncbi:type IV secretion system protein [Halochromatium roseum]|uniref:type IV secretion system protein n=1 Tax=Halochromatium roseum TaxID=391920 RepID=UPI0019130770|nr:type IV secretion system protein [Halochromatium roseum]MBK5938364.1 type IV secretion system protein VirB6 [Halochromatium roseum]